jgi:hypothetical protein
MGSVCSSFSTPAPKSDKSKGFGGSVSDLPKNSATDDLLMDLGIKEKNVQYGRDLADRQARATAATAEMMKNDNNDSSPAATVTATDTATTTDTAADTTTTLDTDTDTALTEVETVSQDTFGEDRDFVGDAGSGASVGTAAGGEAQFDAASATSVGEAEDEALEFMKKGKKSTILTTPGGLLGTDEEEGKTRRRRSLIG